jgi:hypothetical protein
MSNIASLSFSANFGAPSISDWYQLPEVINFIIEHYTGISRIILVKGGHGFSNNCRSFVSNHFNWLCDSWKGAGRPIVRTEEIVALSKLRRTFSNPWPPLTKIIFDIPVSTAHCSAPVFTLSYCLLCGVRITLFFCNIWIENIFPSIYIFCSFRI